MTWRLLGMTFSEGDSSRLVLARSLEWEALPVFATRAIAPIGLFWFNWWQLCLALAACSLLWCPIRSRFVSLRLGMIVSLFNNILVSLPANIFVAVVFFVLGRIGDACVSILWNVLSCLLAFAYPPTRAGTIPEKLWAQMSENLP